MLMRQATETLDVLAATRERVRAGPAAAAAASKGAWDPGGWVASATALQHLARLASAGHSGGDVYRRLAEICCCARVAPCELSRYLESSSCCSCISLRGPGSRSGLWSISYLSTVASCLRRLISAACSACWRALWRSELP